MDRTGGPLVLAALLCQKAHQDQYGFLSLSNVLEELIVAADDPDAPETMPTFRFQGNLVLSMASGSLTGRRVLTLVPWEPDSTQLESISQTVEFQGEDHRVTIISNLSMDITQAGVYWFDIQLDDQLVTSIPLRIIYERRYRQPWIGSPSS